MSPLFSRVFERSQNKVLLRPPYAVQLEAYTLHQGLFVVDLHADSLLWGRDLLKRSPEGHVDLPRLQAGNVALQVFGVVTRFPMRGNFQHNRENTGDMITALALASGWPRRTWGSLLQRALYQAGRLEVFCQASAGKLVPIRTAADFRALREARARRAPVTGGFCALEGVHALEGRLENLDRLYRAGFRIIGLTHFFDNQAGGSAHGMRQGGLTDFGRRVVQRVQELHMLLDLAHASPQVIDDALDMVETPVVVSHTGVKGTFDSPRNLSDAHVRRVAAVGGVIGITLFKGALAAPRLDLAAEAMRYVADLVGVEHVALGSDFDGTILSPVDASGLPLLTETLLSHGFTTREIAAVMGENAARVIENGIGS